MQTAESRDGRPGLAGDSVSDNRRAPARGKALRQRVPRQDRGAWHPAEGRRDPVELYEHTLRDYVRHVRSFGAFIGRSPDTATAEDLRLFQLHQTRTGMQPPSINSYIVHEVLRKPGRPLDAASLAYFEPRFGHDFSQVRVHSGVEAEQSAQALYAHACTVGRDIVFGANRFAPATQDGRWLIAHELTHMVQQNSGQLQAFVQRDPLPPKTVKSDFEEEVLSELHDLEGNRRIQIPAARKQRLFELFSSLHRAEADAI